MMARRRWLLRCLCGDAHFAKVFTYDAPPEGEIRFQFSSSDRYRREILRCERCGHFLSVHEMDAGALYSGDYVNCTYGGDGIRGAFERIISLDPACSDNVGRVERIIKFAVAHLPASTMKDGQPSALDVGSGLCVFLHRMKAAGWSCTALDPDIRAVNHARATVGVTAVCGDFMKILELGSFDLVSFNKVVEHVRDPVGMLAKAAPHVKPGGFVYVEVPDGEAAVMHGPGREEFFIDHWHVFSAASLALLVARAGFALQVLERIREPSGKYTLRAFAVPARPFAAVSAASAAVEGAVDDSRG